MSEQKQFKHTTKKLKDERNKGNILKSPLLTKGLSALAAIIGVIIITRFSWERNRMLLEYGLTKGFLQPMTTFEIWSGVLCDYLLASLGAALIVSICVESFQVGGFFNFTLALPDPKRVNPGEGIQRLAGGFKQVVELIARIIILVAAFWFFRSKELAQFAMDGMVYGSNAPHWSQEMGRALQCGVAVIICLGFVEYGLKRRKYFRDLSMSLDDVRRESKEDEGSPEMKGHRKALHRSILDQDLVRRVRSSKVIIVERKGPKGEG